MIVTKEQLQQMIDEEFDRAVKARGRKKPITEIGGRGSGELWEIDADTLLEFARKYAHMGSTIQEQLDVLVSGDVHSFRNEVSGGGVMEMERRIGGYNEEIDEAIALYSDWKEGRTAGATDDQDDEGQGDLT